MDAPLPFLQPLAQLALVIGLSLLGLIVSPAEDLYKACLLAAGGFFFFLGVLPFALTRDAFPWADVREVVVACVVGFAAALVGYGVRVVIVRLFSERASSQ